LEFVHVYITILINWWLSHKYNNERYFYTEGDTSNNFNSDIGRIGDLPSVDCITAADLVDNPELDDWDPYICRYPSMSSTCVEQEPYYHNAQYHELQSNAAMMNISVCQSTYQPSYLQYWSTTLINFNEYHLHTITYT
jgi:hypothetical protein